MNKISPNKLQNSKWTAVKPNNKEKHFIITEVEYDEDGTVTSCLIEAVMSQRTKSINWSDLKNTEQWIQGWK
jgi:tryptophan-rich hypothetical protein